MDSSRRTVLAVAPRQHSQHHQCRSRLACTGHFINITILFPVGPQALKKVQRYQAHLLGSGL
ncbi:hypothetical protein EB241_11135 [Erwinia psidii]|uniref:Uncharacterized protein n=1 Tax=Erwinia psidii TaxID=69224 RepID=A0A3N6RYQ9_9GAMM|nr:hypothetical protein EB241_11135 [Erwinia psidii]